MATLTTRRIGVAQTIFASQVIGVLSLGALLLVLGDVPAAPLETWALTVAISLSNTLGALLLYRAFVIGTLALVAPVAASYAVTTMLLALLFSGERPALLALSGALLVVGGVVLTAISRRGAGAATLAGLPEVLGVVLCFGVYFWAIEFVTPQMGVFWPVLVVRGLDLIFAGALLAYRRAAPVQMTRALWVGAAVISLLNGMAFILFNIGVGIADTAIITPLSSLSSAITVLLARALLHERLAPWQWGGVALILVGVVLAST